MQFTMKYDMMDWFYPMRHLVGECLQNNILPIWNPYTNLGYPLHTDPQSGALYPVVWILGYLFGYSVYTINLEFVLHLVFAFYGMKKLSEEIGISENIAIVVGLSYACCGFFVGNAQHLSWIIAAAWIPFVAAYYLKMIRLNSWRDALWFSFFAFLLLVGGYPAFTITTFYLLGIAFLVQSVLLLRKKEFKNLKKWILNNVVFGIAFILQSLVFLKYFLESLSYLVRTESLTLANIQILPFSPQSFLSFILPFVTGGNSSFFKTDISMANGYFGLVAFLFLLFHLWKKLNRKSILLWSLGIFFLLVSMGDYFFLRSFLYHYVPMMNLFRYPSLFRIFAILCFLLLFGLSFQNYEHSQKDKKNVFRLRLTIIVLGAIISSLWIYALLKVDLLWPENLTADSIIAFFNKSNNSEMLLIQAPIQILLLLLLLFKTFSKKGMSFLRFAMVIILFDLFLSVQLNCFLTVTSEAKVTLLQEKIDKFPAAFPVPSEPLSSVSHHGNKKHYPIWYNLNILQKRVANNGYNNFKFRAYRSFKERQDAQGILNNQILFESGKTKIDSLENGVASNIKIESFSPVKTSATINFDEDTELTFLQYYYPGWKTYLDGKEIDLFLKEDIFLAVNVPKGKHEIVFEFYPENFLSYFFVSVFAIVLILITLLIYRKRSD